MLYNTVYVLINVSNLTVGQHENLGRKAVEKRMQHGVVR